MILAKHYETVFKFVKVMPRILVASFFPDTVYIQIGYPLKYTSTIWFCDEVAESLNRSVSVTATSHTSDVIKLKKCMKR